MTNPWRGEVRLRINGKAHVCRLTLGALAEMEAALGTDTLVALAERFENRAFSARDVMALLVAGLRGGGWTGDAADLLSAEIEGGPLEAARVAGELLARAFAPPSGAGGGDAD